ncbi:hypothetical protein F2Q70_00039635 [Brassica cretica]|uniref:Uncharacterized protein n=1 Tax=Brassica cretica TaxID=69181 RepID=A0A8S9K8P8_BRACR|nr:hypothetical protein F2Q70_00039635 [Brassica cretica]
MENPPPTPPFETPGREHKVRLCTCVLLNLFLLLLFRDNGAHLKNSKCDPSAPSEADEEE